MAFGGLSLCQSAYNNDVEYVATLIRKGVDINFRDDIGWTPLMNAAYTGAAQTVSFLLEFPNVDVNVSDVNGETALMIAMIKGSLEILKLLLSREDIDVHLRNSDGMTALDIANRSLRVSQYSLNQFGGGLSLNLEVTSREDEINRISNLETMIELLKKKISLEGLESKNDSNGSVHGKNSILKQARTAAKRMSEHLSLSRKKNAEEVTGNKEVNEIANYKNELKFEDFDLKLNFTEEEKPTKKLQKNRMRCFECRKKIGLTGIECSCGYVFCGVHRYPGDHNCDFDFKADARERFQARVPQAAMVDKIVGEKL